MAAGDRFKNWITAAFIEWKANIKTWLFTLFGPIGMIFWSMFRSQIEAEAKTNLKTIADDPDTPPEIKALLEQAMLSANAGGEVIAWFLTIIGSIISILHLGGPQGRNLSYVQDRKLKSFRLDPLTITQIWLRDKSTYSQLWDDLRDRGWSEDRIEVAQELANIIPPLADMVRFADFGSFDPEIIETWREFYDAPDWIREPMSLLGITGDWANKYWFSHWRQPGRFELGELHRRGLIDDGIVKKAYLTQGFSSFWQDKLLELVKQPWTRVDVRRMWDMRTISEAELRKAYQAVGYYDEWLEGMVRWTKVYTDFPVKMAHFKNGWITEDDIRAWLASLDIPADRIEDFIREKTKPEKAERVSSDKALTMSLIVEGVKKGVISREDGVEALTGLGYDEDEAEFILDVRIPVDEEDKAVKERELTKSDIYAGLKNKILTEAEALSELLKLRYTLDDATFIMTIFKARIEPPAEARDREASKADIVLAVKNGLITPEDGYLMLQDIGFTPEAAQFILSVRAEKSPFSPMTVMEIQDIVQKYRAAVGQDSRPVTQELKTLALEVVRLTKEVESLNEAVKAEADKIVDEEHAAAAVIRPLKKLRVSRNRAASELARVKTDYNAKVAEWKHGEG